MTGSLSASSRQLNCLPCVFRPDSTVDDVSAGIPCALPFRSVLVGLVNEPIDSLLRGADYNAHAAVSQDEGNFPAMYHHGRSPTVWASQKVNSLLPRIVPDHVSNNYFAERAASIDAQARSTPEDAGFLSRANEGELCFFSGDLSVDSGETGSPSSGKGLASLCGPRGHQTRHGIPRAADAPEMIGVFDHQFDWLVPQIVAHLVTSEVFTAEEIRSQSTRSGNRTEVPGAYATKGRGARL